MVSSKVGAPLRVMEMFAGVGGFRLGLEGLGTAEHPKSNDYRVVWSSQFEPSTKRQQASEVYVARFGAEGHSNEDVWAVVNDPAKFAAVLAARPDMLVGGFPCQDYSVAKPAHQAAGIEGKKGVLWWSIFQCLKQLLDAGQPVKYLLLENVDRLLKSPTAQRGRDFAIMLASLASLGYAVEWRVVDAADYGFPQRRKRVFIVGYHASTALHQRAQAASEQADADRLGWLTAGCVLAQALPATSDRQQLSCFDVGGDPLTAKAPAPVFGSSCFANAGTMVGGRVFTAPLTPAVTDLQPFTGRPSPVTLGDVVAQTASVPKAFYLDPSAMPRWTYLKGSKSVDRLSRDGHSYRYSEGPVAFPDTLDRASRTIVTGEGGTAPSRFKHVISTTDGRLRRLTPEELEALNGLPRGWTKHDGVSDVRRAFFMGNALVVGLVRTMGAALAMNVGEAAN